MSKKFRQAKWNEPLIFEIGSKEREGFSVNIDKEIKNMLGDIEKIVPNNMLRKKPPRIPSLSEVEVIRHFLHLSQMNYGIDLGPQPLGSCTMKYNPKISEELTIDPRITNIHPYQDENTVQGILKILYDLKKWLCNIVGLKWGSLQPAAGAHGELTGILMIRAFHKDRGEDRDEILIPDSAHGTNPASAKMGGFKVIKIPTREDGCIDLDALKAAVSSRTAGIMLTNPNTLGLFEKDILKITKIVHDAGGLTYYDGANLNGILGIARPGDMGFDIVHINIHKTFATPHGGGGPGACAICVSDKLKNFLPIPVIDYNKSKSRYFLNYNIPKSIGKVRSFYGNIIPLVKAYIYLLTLGPEGIKNVSKISVLNTNYFKKKIEKVKGITIPYDSKRPRKHEIVISFKKLKEETGIRAEDVAKMLLDYGLYAPTIYFPLIVEEAFMIEFTESETKENIDKYIDAIKEIIKISYKNPEYVKTSPRNTSINRLDMVKANHPRSVSPTYWFYLRKKKAFSNSKTY